MRQNKIWARLLGVESAAIVEGVELDVDGDGVLLVARVRKRHNDGGRCSHCRRRCPGYDQGDGQRRWRTLDLGSVRAFIEAEAPRVTCPLHGVVVENMPWSHKNGRFTRCFEQTVAWLAARTDKTAVSTLARIAWRTVGSIIARVVDVGRQKRNPLDGVSRIGIDEVSYRRGRRYLTVVVDHDSGRLLWAGPGNSQETLQAFFDLLGPEGCDAIDLVSADAAAWIKNVVGNRCKNAALCMDPFHVVKWATEAVDKVRREVWNTARQKGLMRDARALKGMKYALLKNPEDLDDRQRGTLSVIEKVNKPLYRAYLLKEQLREVFKLKGEKGVVLLEKWLQWARRSRLPTFVHVAKAVTDNIVGIKAALHHGLSNARVEALNTRMQLLTRLAFGFHSAQALIALAMLKLGGFCPLLPGRSAHENVR